MEFWFRVLINFEEFHFDYRDYPNNDLVIFASDSIEDNAVGWRKDKPVKIITHGWQADGNSPVVQDILHGWLVFHSLLWK